MKILYGVQATGNGHITRARVMQKAFEKKGISVDWVFSGRNKGDFFDMEMFDNFRSFDGLTFIIENGRINNLKTVFNNNLWRFYQDLRHLNVSDYDVVINDFEPVTAWAAKLGKVPSIGLSHQMAFQFDIPKAGSNLLAELVMKFFAPVNYPIGLHWHHYDQNILPPLIEEFTITHPVQDDLYLVYYPFVDLDIILERLRPFDQFKFHIYHQVVNSRVTTEKTYDHISVHSFSRSGFATHLQQCVGVITGAGFELPSEALQMGKKLLLMPLRGQMEQESNALALQQLNYASVSHDFSHNDLSDWLQLPPVKAHNFPDVAEHLVDWIGDGNWSNLAGLKQTLWHIKNDSKVEPLSEFGVS